MVLSVYPGHATYKKNDLFENDEIVYSFDDIIRNWNPKKLMLHIPEVGVKFFNEAMQQKKYENYLHDIDDLHINVMSQNVDFIPAVAEFAELFRFTNNITQTTAHHRYTTQELSNKYSTPVHHLSVVLDRSMFESLAYKEKKNLIVYSPDEHPNREKIIEILEGLEGFKTREIRNLSYKEFEKLTSEAKFSLTFGEGFDGYFVRGFFLGSIGLAVYNDRFFPDKSYLELSSVFDSYESLEKNIVSKIKILDDPSTYDKYVASVQDKLSLLYSYERYVEKMKNFYKEKYDIKPQKNSFRNIVLALLEDRDKKVSELTDDVKTKNKELALAEENITNKQKDIERLNKYISELLTSTSWKVTKPLRRMSSAIRRR